MADWQVVHQDSYENGFYDQDGAGELTIPIKHVVHWREGDGKPRPECDAKDRELNQPEVFAGRFSACVFTTYAKHDAWLVAGPITVQPGARTRASAYTMLVCHGISGDDSKPGDMGTVLGIAESDDVAMATWGRWWEVRDTLDNERIWHKLETPEIMPAGGHVYLFLRTVANWAAAINAAHFDMEVIEQHTGTTPEPGGLQEHIDQICAAVDALQEYVDQNAVKCLIVG